MSLFPIYFWRIVSLTIDFTIDSSFCQCLKIWWATSVLHLITWDIRCLNWCFSIKHCFCCCFSLVAFRDFFSFRYSEIQYNKSRHVLLWFIRSTSWIARFMCFWILFQSHFLCLLLLGLQLSAFLLLSYRYLRLFLILVYFLCVSQIVQISSGSLIPSSVLFILHLRAPNEFIISEIIFFLGLQFPCSSFYDLYFFDNIFYLPFISK